METGKIEYTRIGVRLTGLADIMFDRFIDHSAEVRPAEQKFYLAAGNSVVLPSANIKDGFLFSSNPKGCAVSFEGKRGKDYLAIGMGHVFVDPSLIPFLDEDDKPVIFENFTNGKFRIDMTAGRTKKGPLSIKMEAKPRPVMHLPWSIDFTITIQKNAIIDSTKLYNWFVQGGMQIALGTYRPAYGRFAVDRWEEQIQGQKKRK